MEKKIIIIPRIAEHLNSQLHDGTQYTNYQVGEKIHRLREAYTGYTSFRSDNIGTGFGCDDDCEMINATPEQWEHIRRVCLYLY
jgi:hypothetical protein